MTSTNTRTHELKTNLDSIIQHMAPMLYTLNIVKDGEEIVGVDLGRQFNIKDSGFLKSTDDLHLNLIIRKKKGGLTLN